MTKPDKPRWDSQLEEKADKLVSDILKSGAHRRPEVLALDEVPLFVWKDGKLLAGPRSPLAASLEQYPNNNADDREFIRQLRRTDFPAGSFFVVLWQGARVAYHWTLHRP
jgi:hypothetical protein